MFVRVRSHSATIFTALLLASFTGPTHVASAQGLVSGPKIPASGVKTGNLAKVEPLTGVFLEFQSFKDQGGVQVLGPFKSSNPSVSTSDSEICIDAIATGSPSALLADLVRLGLRNDGTFGRMIGGCLPIDAIDEAASLVTLQFARPAAATRNVGAVDSQSDTAIRADVTRSTHGVDGSGVIIGTLSDSFDCLAGAANDVASGDLPVGINVLDDSACPGTDEGRAMMQLIADVAPGAGQSFHTAFVSQAGFAQGIVDLRNAGADIIVDDVIYFSEPMFQDGVVAQAVDQVKAAGAAYFSSAGNTARRSYQQAFRPSGLFESVLNGELHDFDPGPGVDTFQSVNLPPGTTVFSFQWNDVYASSGPGGAVADFDIWVCNVPNVSFADCPARSTSNNIGSDPIEVVSATVNGGPATVFIALSRYQGLSDRLLKYVTFGPSGFSMNEYNTRSSTVYGHANAGGAVAVGAAFYGNTPEFGTTPPLLESFSSAGDTPIYFDTAGNSIGPVLRQKPEIVAPDGLNNTFFPQAAPPSPDPESDGFPNFFGTSAAAPNAAAAAALLLECNPGLTPDGIYDALKLSAVDMGPPGFDNDTGYGLIDVFMAANVPCLGGSGRIGDFVWDDVDQDGIHDPGEPGRSNVAVNLQDCGGNVLNTTVTDSAGAYIFDNLAVGSYVVRFIAPSGSQFSPPFQGADRGRDSNADPATGLTSCVSMPEGRVRVWIDAGLIQ